MRTRKMSFRNYTTASYAKKIFRNTATTTSKSKVCYREEPVGIFRKMYGQQHYAKVIPHKITDIIKKEQNFNRLISKKINK